MLERSWDFWFVKFCETVQAGFDAPNDLCPGACIDFINLSTLATTFQWYFNGASPDTSTTVNPTNICYPTPGSYDVTLIASNATASDTLILTGYITVYPYSPTQSILQNGDTLISNTGFVSYQWFYFGDTIPGATNYFYLATWNGDYSVVCLDSNGCSVEAVLQNVLATLPEEGGIQGLVVYTNPAGSELGVRSSELGEKPTAIYIYNIMGERLLAVLLRTTNNELRTIDISALHSGFYTLQITAGNRIFQAKFIRQ